LERVVTSLKNDEDKFSVVIDLNDFGMSNADTKWFDPLGFQQISEFPVP
jgi:hypothetical protein